MNTPNFSEMLEHIRAAERAAAAYKAEDARLMHDCLKLADDGAFNVRPGISLAGAAIMRLPALNSAEAIYLSACLAVKLRGSENATNNDGLAAAIESELPAALWCLTDGGDE